MRSRYKIIQKEGIYFVTSTTVEWIPIFTTRKYFDIIMQSLKFCKNHKGLRLYAFVILDNHFHLVVSAPKLSDTLAPEHWLYSSSRNYLLNDHSIIQIDEMPV